MPKMLKKALFICDAFERIYSPETVSEFEEIVDIHAPPQGSDILASDPGLLGDTEIIMSGWGAPVMDREFLDAAPRLEAVFYGAGSIRKMTSEEFWRRGITVSSAWGINAIPVAQFALAQILLSLKLAFHSSVQMRRIRKSPDLKKEIHGIHGGTVGIISLGQIGRRVAELLEPFGVVILAYDPFVTEEEGDRLGVQMVSLEEIFTRSEVISLHTPWLKETENMITGRHFASMKRNATFINTARGAVVCQDEMLKVLGERPDIFALLDVVYPARPAGDSLLWSLPNVMQTPHIAGSQGRECFRMGETMLRELRRYLSGEPLEWEISEERASVMA